MIHYVKTIRTIALTSKYLNGVTNAAFHGSFMLRRRDQENVHHPAVHCSDVRVGIGTLPAK